MNAAVQAVFDGIKVLDLTRVVSGPWATQMMADQGACVYKIEEIGIGDMTRRLPPLARDTQGQPVPGVSAFYLGVNRGKQSVQVDLQQPEGADLVRQLAQQCDVVIENFKAGGLRKFGLDYASVQAANPSVVYCSISGFGVDGPYAARPAYDFVLQGMAGLMSTCGHPDGEPGAAPMRTAVPITDIFTGFYAAYGIASALFHRQRTGEGQFIDIGMIDAAVAVNAHLALEYLMTGNAPGRVGNTNPVGAPSDVFACSDGHLIVAVGSDMQFAALCKELGQPQWCEDPRWTTAVQRVQHREPLRAAIASLLLGHPRAVWIARFNAANVPCGPVNTLQDVFDDVQVRHRDLALTLQHPAGFNVPTLRNPIRFARTPVQHRAPPTPGEHTETVLTQVLGLDAAQVAALRSREVIQ
jgi:crotonobetainyl-CoA:carnitine CoA-transferase CaiB-like acyl-CoA transferase